MKRNRVLLGLFVGLITLAGGPASAQGNGDKFYEIGPSNISGEVSSIVLGPQDPDRTTLYAGSASGGLFVRSSNREVLNSLYSNADIDEARKAILVNDTDSWHRVPFIRPDGREVVLPISRMVAAPDGAIYIGTGAALGSGGSNYNSISRSGIGIYRYTPADGKFTLLNESDEVDRFPGITALDYIYRNDTMYLYVGTPSGLFRWAVADSDAENGAWADVASRPLITGQVVTDIKVVRQYRTAYVATTQYYTTGNAKLFKIGNATLPDDQVASSLVDITSSNAAFATTGFLKLAVSPTEPNYLYALALTAMGFMDNLYLTTNGQSWTTLTTNSVGPFTYTQGTYCGTLCVDPKNPKRIIIGGTDIWIGEGYVENSYYQWTASSSNEYSLMYQSPATGDYMSRVFNSSYFVHSGIMDILPVLSEYEGEPYYYYYIATMGGVFYTTEYFGSYRNINRGLNTISVNGLSVAPDGTVLIGADNNGCPVIEPHLAHFGGEPTISWFDDGSLGNFNHDANIIWKPGTGGAVAASSFQQYSPQTRRTIFTSSANSDLGRSYADYLDFLNTSTWTTGTGFMTNEIDGGPLIGTLYLWETDTNTVFNSTVKGTVDTLGYIFRRNSSTQEWDTVWVNDPANGTNRGSKFDIRRGDKAIFNSRGHASYPFEYIYTENHKAGDTIIARNPIQSRMVTVGAEPGNSLSGDASVVSCVWYSWLATDFTKVWDVNKFESGVTSLPSVMEELHFWSPILAIRRVANSDFANVYPRNAVISNNGKVVYASAYDTQNRRSLLFRIRGFEKVDFSNPNGYQVKESMSYNNANNLLTIDTLKYNDSSIWFPRAISSIAVDPRQGEDRLILTFDGYSYRDNFPNVMEVRNASTNNVTIVPIPLVDQPQIPAYCALVEDSTGTLYVGTENGVFTKDAAGWTAYTNIPEMPVTAIYQQTRNYPVRRYLTHTGIQANDYVFAKTKWPRAIYFGTSGRGVFMDMQYVTDTVNEIVDSVDYTPVSIPSVHSVGLNSVSLYPNPVTTETTLELTSAVAGNASLQVFDLNGRCVVNRSLGHVAEGKQTFTLSSEGLSKGMYLVNVIIGGHTAATKMMVR